MAKIIDFASGEQRIPKGDHSRFYVLLKKMAGEPTKEELVANFTNGATESLSEMWEFYPKDYREMLRFMDGNSRGQVERMYKQQAKRKHVPDAVREGRSNILKACAEWGISDTGDGSFWKDINGFLLNPRVAGKAIYAMQDSEEMQAVVKRIKTMIWNRNNKEQ
jgi:hypothetical protein